MTDFDNDNGFALFVDSIYHSVIANSNSITLTASEFLAALSIRIVC